jgi:hypothetical protein
MIMLLIREGVAQYTAYRDSVEIVDLAANWSAVHPANPVGWFP